MVYEDDKTSHVGELNKMQSEVSDLASD